MLSMSESNTDSSFAIFEKMGSLTIKRKKDCSIKHIFK